MNAIVYDIEIFKCIPDNKFYVDDINPVTGQPYLTCEGWTDFAGMGIGVLCVWDCLAELPLVFTEQTMPEFGQLVAQRNLVVGFNSHRFDNQICEAFGVSIPDEKSLDLLRLAYQRLGQNPDRPTVRGYKLDAFARANFGAGKTENGADAPRMAQRGEWARLTNYCFSDVMLTYRLLLEAMNGTLIDPVTLDNLPLSFQNCPLEKL